MKLIPEGNPEAEEMKSISGSSKEAGGGKTVAEKAIESKVQVYEMLGDYAYLYVFYAGQKVSVRVPADTLVKRGDKVKLAPDMEKIHLFDALRENRI